MRNKKLLVLSFLGLASVVGAVSGCNRQSKKEQIDASKTQLYVNNFKRGFGGEWLLNLKTRFEENQKDVVWEEGKKGVQVVIHNADQTAESRIDKILSGEDEVFFSEQSYYYNFLQKGILGDITDAVTGSLNEFGENKTIKSKLTEQQIDFLGVEKEGSDHFYAVPHYSGYYGIIADIDLFNDEKLYFSADPIDVEMPFVQDLEEERTAGPDGLKGTYDDGFPATYDEYFKLCDYMLSKDLVPFISTGQTAKGYLNLLVNNLSVDHEGLEEMTKYYQAEGTLNDCGTVDADGNVTKGEPVAITPATGYKAHKMLGKYYGLNFLSRLSAGSKNGDYMHKDVDTSTYSETASIDDFLFSRVTGQSSKKPVGMLGCGIWWENIATTSFDTMATSFNKKYGRSQSKFAFMPFPKATDAKYQEAVAAKQADPTAKTTNLFDHLFSLQFMKSGLPELKQRLAKKFIQFSNTDASLIDFTKTTNTPKALNYVIPEADKAELSYFGRTLMELKESSNVIYPSNGSRFFQNNSDYFHVDKQFRSTVGGKIYDYAFEGIRTNKVSAPAYFNGLETYYESQWPSRNL